MKKIVAVLWHNSANRLAMVQKETASFVDLKIYSAGALSSGKQDLQQLYGDMDDADLLLLNVTSSDAAWSEIDTYLQTKNKSIVYIGSEASLHVKSQLEVRYSAQCNLYYNYSGKENLVQMIRYLCAEVLREPVPYEEPIFIPWEGIFHPDTPEIFKSAEEYFRFRPRSPKGTVGLVVSRTSWLNGDCNVELELLRLIEARGYSVLPIYSYSMADDELGAKGVGNAIEQFCFWEDGTPVVQAMIRMTGYFVGYGSGHGDSTSVLRRLNCPVIKPICSYSMTVEEWEGNTDGAVNDVAWSIALPEMEGVIEPIFIGAEAPTGDYELRVPIGKRCKKLVDRVLKWVDLKQKSNGEKKVVFLLNNNPCTSAEASVGGGANLDTLESVAKILQQMEKAGYDLTDVPETGEELIQTIMSRKAISEFRWTPVSEIVSKGGALDFVDSETYRSWFSELTPEAQHRMVEAWGNPPGEEKDGVPPSMVYDGKLVISGISFRNALVCVQPKRGCAGARCDGTVCKILHDPAVPPTHQYLATYRYFERIYGADVIIHVGTHGNLEFLPGKGTGLSDSCFPDICIGSMTNLYIYNSDNPPEGTIAKRRALATVVDHMQTTMVQGGLYDQLEELDQLLAQYEKTKLADHAQAHILEHMVKELAETCHLETIVSLENYHERFGEITEALHKYLSMVRNTQIQSGMHVFGQIPQGQDRIEMLYAILRYDNGSDASLRRELCGLIGLDLSELLKDQGAFCVRYQKDHGTILHDLDRMCKDIIDCLLHGKSIAEHTEIFDAYRIKKPEQFQMLEGFRERILQINASIEASKEMESLLQAMDGSFVPPGPAGMIMRGREDVLPTGRNFYTLDPETVPTKAAWEIGKRLGDALLENFLKEEGRYPESVAFYWMTTDIMWADGEGLAQMLYLLGVRPVWKSNGKVCGFEVIPLSELNHPRIDLTVKVSGILRDNFKNCIELLDEAIQTVAEREEPEVGNYVRKHALENQRNDPEMTWNDATARIFGAKPGTYSSGINLIVYASSWVDQKDISDLFTFSNGYAYGRTTYGKQSYQQLRNSLKNVEVTFDKVMSDEHDLLGCCCYFSNHGGMTAAARELSDKEIKTYYGDTREVSNVEIRTLSEEINRVVSGKLLNPRWIEGQKKHGYKGAGDISKRIGRVYGWEATTEAVEDWIFDDIVKTFISNQENREFFQKNNPWAMEEISRRLMEAYSRKLWQPEEGLIEELQDHYLELESILEENMGDAAGEFQGGSIDVVPMDELQAFREQIAKLHGKSK